MGDWASAHRHIEAADHRLGEAGTGATVTGPICPKRYAGATLLDLHGNEIGEVDSVVGGQVHLALGGVRDFWGLFDFSAHRQVVVPADELVFGPARRWGWSYVVYPGASQVASSR